MEKAKKIHGNVNDLDNEVVTATCKISQGSGKCGNKYTRAAERENIRKKLYEKNMYTSIFRVQEADKLMDNDGKKPPHLYTENTYKKAKYEYVESQHIDRNPIRALELMQIISHQYVIQTLSINPFTVHYWTNH